MAALTDHECLKQPIDPNIKLWRYMDFTKFVSLLSSKSLFFCNADKFIDKFEGTYPIFDSFQLVEKCNDPLMSKSLIEDFYWHQGINKMLRNIVYINCWHANEYESAAMWTLYAKTDEAIAIETCYSTLKNALPENVFLGMINYIDYEKEGIPRNNTLSPFMYKRKSFDHEREVRAFIPQFDLLSDTATIPPDGLPVKIDLNDLIKTIHISPTAPQWFETVVTDVAAIYGITAEISKSNLYSDPFY